MSDNSADALRAIAAAVVHPDFEEALKLPEYRGATCPKCGFGTNRNDISIKRQWLASSKAEVLVFACYCGYRWRRPPLDEYQP